jgi:hypothetical protein
MSFKYPREKTAQEIFDEVSVHLIKQNAKSHTPGTGCVYLDPVTGNRCAAGCLIKPGDHGPEHLVAPWEELVRDHTEYMSVHDQLIEDLQDIHDTTHPTEWPKELRKVASSRELETITMDQLLSERQDAAHG